MKKILSFQGEFRFLSNFHPAPLAVTHKSGVWCRVETVENGFQALKCEEIDQFLEICTAATPGQAKRLGRKAKLREDWFEVRLSVMEDLLRKKFLPGNIVSTAKLKATGDAELIEGNHWHDNFWGQCWCQRCEGKLGENRLGWLLMKIRKEL